MTKRRGFTLVELLVGLMLIALVGGVIYKLLVTMQRSARRQAEQANLQENVRAGGLIIPAELREIGFDSNQATNAVTTDLIANNATSVRFRAMRGVGITCAISSSEIRIWPSPNFFGYRLPQVGDSLLLFIERTQSLALDDEWEPLSVSAVNASSTCNGQPAIALSLGNPIAHSFSLIFVGAPIRVFRPAEFGLYTSNGRSWLGTRSSANDSYQPVLGPLADGNGFELRYYNGAGTTEIAAGTSRNAVRQIRITLRGRSDEPVAFGAGQQQQIANLNLTTTVALRNTLRP